LKFTGKVTKGKLKLYDKEGFNRSLSKYEGDVWLEIKEAEKTHSPKQNAYYRAIIREIANELGYTEHEMHETVKTLFEIESTKDLNVADFSDYLDKIIRHFAQLGYPVQDPRGR
tara:strand:+ start:1049 stop:1390 length:342 start_codon:yes stop_codon:yes gene_type:complete